MRPLATAIKRVGDGRGQVVLVTGPAGIGKTRFCEENALLAQEAGFAVIWGRCWSDGGAPALWPWEYVLSQVCGLETAGLLDQETGPDVDSGQFSRFVAVVDRLASARRPTYIVLDDLHAAESAAVLLTRFVARMRHRLPILIVITVRETAEGDRARRVIELLGPESTRIRLGQLSAADTGDLLAAHGAADTDPALVSVVHQMTAGNPLYLHRLLALASVGSTADLPKALAMIGRTGVESFESGEATVGTRTEERLDPLARSAGNGVRVAARAAPAVGGMLVSIIWDDGRWVVAHRGRRVVVGDLAGMRHLARLVARPGVPIPALELVGEPMGLPEPGRQAILDRQAKMAYGVRARELAAEVAEARAHADLARVERLEAEIEALARELDRATGLGGRTRHFVVPAERARTSVRKAIKRALDAVEAADPTVAAELRAAVTTGYLCSYDPDAAGPVHEPRDVTGRLATAADVADRQRQAG
jgi:hypothetical protein